MNVVSFLLYADSLCPPFTLDSSISRYIATRKELRLLYFFTKGDGELTKKGPADLF